ncbi:MAG TPA: pantoate--beta-alanine ligase [Mycobacteriales bacterium]|jgi:pantoate--beta-alanine ligase|nr:pantoate--beta-alanine ligase [Mycobacteriales bacterium]
MPVLATTRQELEAARKVLPGRVAVVMTMGALHEGHAALIRAARERADSVIVTIFVNPLQFGAGEDLDRYPRTLDDDLLVCAREGADVVFAPAPDVVYPSAPVVRVQAGALGEGFEGASRPGHFDGMLTVVLKLLHLVHPDVALFGQKDAQQLACIRAMVRDLDVPVDIVAVPTVRESDGLALSSRNRYLSPDQRLAALALSRALATGNAPAARAVLAAEPGVAPDYLERVRSSDFQVDPAGDLLVVAARVGSTRLIDNVVLTSESAD